MAYILKKSRDTNTYDTSSIDGYKITQNTDNSCTYKPFGKEDAQKFCDDYNEKYKDIWPKLHYRLMTESEMKAWISEHDYEHEIWDNYGI